ncbi:putative plant self-incompatibility S1 [Lupinus albus]|uniref:Putative plant self-incompatibility S1 n=1 Tax=Lupinus albus TaxID=3870 RepID=A0A6A4P5Y8_LUPAL|nr:putative plant self-incompatibility S1 [Lupinus albus]
MFLSISMKHVYVFLLALQVIAFWESSPVVSGESKITVIIRNSLHDDLNATIHCKSGEGNDLGVHEVPNYSFNRATYDLVFEPNISHTTLYLCAISWKEASLLYVFYSYKRDIERCGTHCLWDILNGGIVGYSTAPGFVSIYVKWPNHAN